MEGSERAQEREIRSDWPGSNALTGTRERAKNFDEVQQGFTEEMAVQEAQRCLSCGCTCIQACPFGAMQFNPVACTALKCEPCYERLKMNEEPGVFWPAPLDASLGVI